MDLETRDKIVKKADVHLERSDLRSGVPPRCACGCGQPVNFTKGSWSRFRPGHDARLVARMLQMCRDRELSINDAVEFLSAEFSERLAAKLLRFWQGRSGKTQTCRELVECGRPSSAGDAYGRCDRHRAT